MNQIEIQNRIIEEVKKNAALNAVDVSGIQSREERDALMLSLIESASESVMNTLPKGSNIDLLVFDEVHRSFYRLFSNKEGSTSFQIEDQKERLLTQIGLLNPEIAGKAIEFRLKIRPLLFQLGAIDITLAQGIEEYCANILSPQEMDQVLNDSKGGLQERLSHYIHALEGVDALVNQNQRGLMIRRLQFLGQHDLQKEYEDLVQNYEQQRGNYGKGQQDFMSPRYYYKMLIDLENRVRGEERQKIALTFSSAVVKVGDIVIQLGMNQTFQSLLNATPQWNMEKIWTDYIEGSGGILAKTQEYKRSLSQISKEEALFQQLLKEFPNTSIESSFAQLQMNYEQYKGVYSDQFFSPSRYLRSLRPLYDQLKQKYDAHVLEEKSKAQEKEQQKQEALKMLHQQAGKISDPIVRQSFLQKYGSIENEENPLEAYKEFLGRGDFSQLSELSTLFDKVYEIRTTLASYKNTPQVSPLFVGIENFMRLKGQGELSYEKYSQIYADLEVQMKRFEESMDQEDSSDVLKNNRASFSQVRQAMEKQGFYDFRYTDRWEDFAQRLENMQDEIYLSLADDEKRTYSKKLFSLFVKKTQDRALRNFSKLSFSLPDFEKVDSFDMYQAILLQDAQVAELCTQYPFLSTHHKFQERIKSLYQKAEKKYLVNEAKQALKEGAKNKEQQKAILQIEKSIFENIPDASLGLSQEDFFISFAQQSALKTFHDSFPELSDSGHIDTFLLLAWKEYEEEVKIYQKLESQLQLQEQCESKEEKEVIDDILFLESVKLENEQALDDPITQEIIEEMLIDESLEEEISFEHPLFSQEQYEVVEKRMRLLKNINALDGFKSADRERFDMMISIIALTSSLEDWKILCTKMAQATSIDEVMICIFQRARKEVLESRNFSIDALVEVGKITDFKDLQISKFLEIIVATPSTFEKFTDRDIAEFFSEEDFKEEEIWDDLEDKELLYESEKKEILINDEQETIEVFDQVDERLNEEVLESEDDVQSIKEEDVFFDDAYEVLEESEVADDIEVQEISSQDDELLLDREGGGQDHEDLLLDEEEDEKIDEEILNSQKEDSVEEIGDFDSVKILENSKSEIIHEDTRGIADKILKEEELEEIVSPSDGDQEIIEDILTVAEEIKEDGSSKKSKEELANNDLQDYEKGEDIDQSHIREDISFDNLDSVDEQEETEGWKEVMKEISEEEKEPLIYENIEDKEEVRLVLPKQGSDILNHEEGPLLEHLYENEKKGETIADTSADIEDKEDVAFLNIEESVVDTENIDTDITNKEELIADPEEEIGKEVGMSQDIDSEKELEESIFNTIDEIESVELEEKELQQKSTYIDSANTKKENLDGVDEEAKKRVFMEQEELKSSGISIEGGEDGNLDDDIFRHHQTVPLHKIISHLVDRAQKKYPVTSVKGYKPDMMLPIYQPQETLDAFSELLTQNAVSLRVAVTSEGSFGIVHFYFLQSDGNEIYAQQSCKVERIVS